MRRVLIITYYWPPSGGSAVLRWLKFVKYLREFGWEPIIYTPSNPEPLETDESLVHDIPENLTVLKKSILEPYGIYKWLTGRKKSDRLGVALMTDKKHNGFIQNLSLWLRSNLFIPDPRAGWIRPSVRYLEKYLARNPTDLIITTGPPHSMHLIGLKLKKKLGIKWVADFRDPWTNIDFYRELLLTGMADRIHHYLEKSVLQQADHVITVSHGMTKDFKAMGMEKVTTITNGYDDEGLRSEIRVTGKFSILHLGSMPKSRNPDYLWKVLAEMARENDLFAADLEIHLVGKVDNTIIESLERENLMKFVHRQSFIEHAHTFELLVHSSVLLLCINNTPNAEGILTNKFFEYLSAKRPILAIGPPEGDAAFILHDTHAGEMFGYNDCEILRNFVDHLYLLHTQHKLEGQSHNIEKYSRRYLTGQLAELLNQIIA